MGLRIRQHRVLEPKWLGIATPRTSSSSPAPYLEIGSCLKPSLRRKARHGKARQGKARQGMGREGKGRQGQVYKARQGQARPGQARKGKARQCKTRRPPTLRSKPCCQDLKLAQAAPNPKIQTLLLSSEARTGGRNAARAGVAGLGSGQPSLAQLTPNQLGPAPCRARRLSCARQNAGLGWAGLGWVGQS